MTNEWSRRADAPDNVIPFPGTGLRMDCATEGDDLPVAREEGTMLRLLIDLEHSYPPVWRRVEVATDLRLDQLHDVISTAMGWEDIHLHAFRSTFRGDVGVVLPTLFTDADLDEAETDELGAIGGPAGVVRTWDRMRGERRDEVADLAAYRGVHESALRVGQVLADVEDVLHYDYDMASAWRHLLTVEAVRVRGPGEARARFIDGERACPPEDCGGVWTYNDIVAVLAGDAIDVLQTDLDDVDDQIDWLPDGFDPAAFDASDVRARIAAIELLDPPPPMPPLETLVPALRDLVCACGTRGRRAAARLLGEAQLDATTIVTAQATSRGRPVVDTARALATDSGAGADLPKALDEASCAWMVGRFRDLLDAIDAAAGEGVTAGECCPFSRRLVSAAVAVELVECVDGRLRHHPSAPPADASARDLVEAIARRLPLGRSAHEAGAGAVALLCAAAGVTRAEFVRAGADGPALAQRVAGLCRTVIEDAGWRTRAGHVDEATITFWADETWSVLSLLGGDDGPEPGRLLPTGTQTHGCPSSAAGGTVPPGPPRQSVRALARAALRIH